MSRPRRTARRRLGVLGAVPLLLLSACSIDRVTNPLYGEEDSPAVPVTPLGSGLVCETITFSEGGLKHGDRVTSITVGALTIGFSVAPYLPDFGYPGSAPSGTLRVFDTNNQTHPEDTDLMVPPAGHCEECRGQGNVLIIEHERGFASAGDYRWGGAITLTGFPAGYYVRSFKGFDNDACVDFPPEEATIKLLVGGEVIAESSNRGTGTAETVDVSKIKPTGGSVVFSLGTPARDPAGGSGALDDIVVCRTN